MKEKLPAADPTGIGVAIESMVHVYRQTARQTGRTSQMLRTLKDGDRVYVATGGERLRLERACKEAGINAEIVMLDPRRPGDISNRPPCAGAALFEHSWVEEFYLDNVRRMQNHIREMQEYASGKTHT